MTDMPTNGTGRSSCSSWEMSNASRGILDRNQGIHCGIGARSLDYWTVTVTADELEPESEASPAYLAVIEYWPAGIPFEEDERVATPDEFMRAVPIATD